MKISAEMLSEAEMLVAQITVASQEAAGYVPGCISFGCGLSLD